VKKTAKTCGGQLKDAVEITDEINREEENLIKIRTDIEKDKENGEQKVPISEEHKSPTKVVTEIIRNDREQIEKKIEITKELTKTEKGKVETVIHNIIVHPPKKEVIEVTKSHECPTCKCAEKLKKTKKLQKKVLAEMAKKSIQDHL